MEVSKKKNGLTPRFPAWVIQGFKGRGQDFKHGGDDGCQPYACKRAAAFSLHLVSADAGVRSEPGRVMCLSLGMQE